MSDTLAVMPTFLREKKDLIVTENAILTLLASSDADLLVVDDHSPDVQLALRVEEICRKAGAEFERRPQNDGFSAAVNVGLRRARRSGRNALLVNADTEFRNDEWLDHMRGNDADVVGALLLYPNGLVQHAGVFFSIINRHFDHIYRLAPGTLAQVREPRICPVTGALMLIKHHTLEKVGVFDENFHFCYEDVDYCHMVFKAGLECAYEPQAEVVHHESWFASRPSKKVQQWMQDGWIYLHEKHRGWDFSEHIPTLIWDEGC